MVTRRMVGGTSPRKALGPDRRRTCIPETRLSDTGSGVVSQGDALWGRRQSRGHCQLQATNYTHSRIKAARIFDKLVIIAIPCGTPHKPSTLTGRWFVQMVTTLSGLGCTAPVAQETFTNRLRKSSVRYDLKPPEKGRLKRNIL